MTNYEKIKKMSIEEMAKKIPFCLCDEKYMDCDCKSCVECCKEWLESEAVEE